MPFTFHEVVTATLRRMLSPNTSRKMGYHTAFRNRVQYEVYSSGVYLLAVLTNTAPRDAPATSASVTAAETADATVLMEFETAMRYEL